MGINGFYKFLAQHAPKSVQRVKITELKGAVVAIDASLAIYQWYAVGQSRGIMHNGKVSNHIQGMFLRTSYLLEQNITPIYVFDGVPPDSKQLTLTARRATRRVHIHHGAFNECKELLTLMGVSYLVAEADAEAKCAQLTIDGYCDYVMSRDSDSLVFGARGLIKDINLNTNYAEVISLADVLNELKLTMEQFVDLCVLIGSDYNRGIMSPMKALRAVRETTVDKLKLTDADMKAVVDTREVFTKKYNHSDVITSDAAPDELMKFLTKFGIGESKICLGLQRMGIKK